MKFKGEFGYKIILRLFNWLFKIIQKYEVINKELLPKSEGSIYVINHRDYYDIPIIFSILGARPIYALVKEELKNEIAGKVVKLMGAVFVDRADPKSRENAKNKLISLVLENKNILIAPEGTRNKTDELLLPFIGKGAVSIAKETGKPIIPFVISKYKKGKKKLVKVCNPYFVNTNDDLNEANKKLYKIMYEALLQNEIILLSETIK